MYANLVGQWYVDVEQQVCMALSLFQHRVL
jgi:hypothetical protein